MKQEKGNISQIEQFAYEAIPNEAEFIEGNSKVIGQGWEFNKRFEYDTTGQLIKSHFFDENRHPFSTTFNKYNSKGLLISSETYNSNGVLDYSSHFEYEYDKHNNLLIATEKRISPTYQKTFLKYFDREGKILRTTYKKKDGSLERGINYQYAETGQLLQSTQLDSQGNLITLQYQFDYDKQGNWIKKVILKEDIPVEIIVRVLSYRDK